MTLEVITKAIEDHGKAVNQIKTDLNGSISAIHQDVKTLVEKSDDLERRLDDFEIKANRPDFGPGSPNTKNPLDTFIKSSQLAAMNEGAMTTGRVELKNSSLKLLQKAVTSATYDVQPQRADGLYNDPRQRLSLISVLPTLPVESGVFEFMQLSTYTNNAAIQGAEGDAKAQSDPTFAPKQVNISTIAHWAKASLQILQDAPALGQQLNNLLAYGTMQKLESQLINGDGTSGSIDGLINQATAFTPTVGLSAADRIGEAAVSLGAAGWQPSAILMGYLDWFTIARSKDTTDERYLLGSPRDPSPLSLWGIPVITCASMPSGTALVLDTQQVAILDRMSPSVMASRQDGTNFTTNMVTILAELRAGLAVFAEDAVQSVSLV